MRIRIEIPIKDLIAKLKINKFILTNSNGMSIAIIRKDLINFSYYKIVTFYNHYITRLLNFYSFTTNLSSLSSIFIFLQMSCTLILALKYKIRI